MSVGGWENFADFCRSMAETTKQGRPTLRRKWSNLLALAAEVLPLVPDEAAHALLGKSKALADPEENDIKALLSYAVGRGLLAPERVADALTLDRIESPLYWLAGLSGKAFGETIAPSICAYWLRRDNEPWMKMKASDYYDVRWTPSGRQPVRIEIKASSEWPNFRFQQVRDPRYTGAPSHDYDSLLCLGVTAATLEFWFIPSGAVAKFIDNGTLVNQHGGTKIMSNTFWFVADGTTRRKLEPYAAEAPELRNVVLHLTDRA